MTSIQRYNGTTVQRYNGTTVQRPQFGTSYPNSDLDPDYIKYNRLLVEHKTDALALDRNTFVWRDGKNLILATKGNYRPKAEIRLGGYKISPNPLEGVEFPTRVISHDQYTKIKDSCKKID